MMDTPSSITQSEAVPMEVVTTPPPAAPQASRTPQPSSPQPRQRVKIPRVPTFPDGIAHNRKVGLVAFILSLVVSLALMMGVLFVSLKPAKCIPKANTTRSGAATSGAHISYPFFLKFVPTDGNYTHECIGNVLTGKWVLLQSWCVYDYEAETQIGGVLKTVRTTHHIQYMQMYSRDVSNITLSLVRVLEALPLNELVWPVELPRYGLPIRKGMKGVAFSMQKTEYAVYKSYVKIYSHRICQIMLDSGYKLMFKDNFFMDSDFCAGEVHGFGMKCVYDVRGPLIYKNATLVGLYKSNPVPCGGKRLFPSVYINVGDYVDWIEEVMIKHS